MDTHFMDNICSTPFWNQTLTWDTDNPDLTSCFQETILIWIPCIFIWITSPFSLIHWNRTRSRLRIPWTLVSILKQLFCFILILLSLSELIKSLISVISSSISDSKSSNQVYPVEYLSPLVQFTTFSLVFILMSMDRKKSINCSALFSLFWSAYAVVSIIIYRSIWLSLLDTNYTNWSLDTFKYGMKIVSIPLIVAEFFLTFFSDSLPASYVFPGEEIDNLSPMVQASFPSILTYWWLNPLILLGYKRPIVQEDLYNLPPEYSTQVIVSRLFPRWQPMVSKSVTGPLFKTYAPQIGLVCFLQLINTLLTFVSPVILDKLLVWMVTREHLWQGVFYALIIFFTSVIKTLIGNNYYFKLNMIAVSMRTALTSVIYDKSLKLSPESRAKYTIGQVVNIMSVDASKVMFFMMTINMAWTAPLQIVISIVLLWNQLGPYATLAGMVIMVIVAPINGLIMKIWKRSQIIMMKHKDSRSKLISEMLSGMKVIKLYGWEHAFTDQVKDVRRQEMACLKKQSIYMSFIGCLLTATPVMVALVSFITFILVDSNNVLTASKAFVSLSLFNILRMPLSFAPMVITQIAVFSVSMKRINEYLNAEESDADAVQKISSADGLSAENRHSSADGRSVQNGHVAENGHKSSDENAITVKNGIFSWTKFGDPVLQGINIVIPRNKLVAIVGTVGSGKSSLLSALLGDTYKREGAVSISGSIAFVPQQAWIQNATLKSNVLFKSNYDANLYDRVISAAALTEDLKVLPAGDETEIGEKGINLSGGQKQRVSLARAVYANRDIYLLDDPLSAVDSHVGKHIFDQIIGKIGLLKDKTRILVTHKVSLLPQVDLILVIKNGQVSEAGTYQELLDAKGAFADFLIEYLVKAEEELEGDEIDDVIDEVKKKLAPELERHKSIVSQTSVSSGDLIVGSPGSKDGGKTSRKSSVDTMRKSPIRSDRKGSGDTKADERKSVQLKKPVGRLTEREAEQIGTVSWSVYMEYFRSAGTYAVIAILLVTIATSGLGAGSNFWLTSWSTDGTNPERVNDTSFRNLRIGVYAGLGLAQSGFAFISSFLTFLGTLTASYAIHNAMIDRIVRCPMAFFDTTPVGRVMNRFTKDIDSLDTSIRMNFKNFLATSFTSLIAIVVISSQTPIFIVAILPLAVVYYVIQKIYIPTSRQLNRIEANTKSPIYSHFGETITGCHCIRAYGAVDTFRSECEEKIDSNTQSYILSNCSGKWLSVRLELMGALIVLLTAVFAVTNYGIDAATAGLIISYALTITNTLDTLVRSSADLENNLVSVERCLEYTRIPSEADWYNEVTSPSSDWPSKGVVKFNNYSTRYRDGLELILRGINFETCAGEKVGIVGRTGAGKSSLTLALLRLIEPVEGTILIDGVDIRTLGLMDLRTRLTIIPQDPVLFTGSLRKNLDPFNLASDDAVWSVLELVHLKDFVSSLDGGLDHTVSEGGENLSVGQRQLVCLGRALLRKSKVLILDEATAAVDLETDHFIQDTIRNQFSDCTILTIAHRLNTVLDYDRILVLDAGQVAEFDTPNKLMQKTDSLFHSLAKDAKLI